MTAGLLIGRFQPFHKGHLSAVKQILEQNDKVIIGIGSSQYKHTKENPFTAEERKEMIQKTLDNNEIKDYEIVFIPDIHDDEKWALHVETLCPPFNIVYTNSQRTRKCFEILNKYPTKAIEIEFDISSTEIRRRIKEGEDWDELVPKEIFDEIIRIDGVERIKKIKD
jgi:nicotinamide-nucleotide adenylyltransferase